MNVPAAVDCDLWSLQNITGYKVHGLGSCNYTMEIFSYSSEGT
jgi:hypothetical protein